MNKVPKICEVLGVNIDQPFNIEGQHISNPYVFKQTGTFITLKNCAGETVSSWVICGLLEGTMTIESEE